MNELKPSFPLDDNDNEHWRYFFPILFSVYINTYMHFPSIIAIFYEYFRDSRQVFVCGPKPIKGNVLWVSNKRDIFRLCFR